MINTFINIVILIINILTNKKILLSIIKVDSIFAICWIQNCLKFSQGDFFLISLGKVLRRLTDSNLFHIFIIFTIIFVDLLLLKNSCPSLSCFIWALVHGRCSSVLPSPWLSCLLIPKFKCFIDLYSI